MRKREIAIEDEAVRSWCILDMLAESLGDKMQDAEAKPLADYLFAVCEVMEDCSARLKRVCCVSEDGE